MEKLLSVSPMTQDEVEKVVKSVKPGSYHTIIWQDGAPIPLKEEKTLYVAKKASVRFNLKYENLPTTKIENAILKSISKEDLEACDRMLSSLDERRKPFLSNRIMKVLSQKKVDIENGKEIYATKKRENHREYDAEKPFLVYCLNGNVLLECFSSLAYKVVHKDGTKTYEPRKVETLYYIKYEDGSTVEIDKSKASPRLKKALEKAAEVARTAAGKKNKSAPTPVFTPAINHIFYISGPNSKKKKIKKSK